MECVLEFQRSLWKTTSLPDSNGTVHLRSNKIDTFGLTDGVEE